MLPYFSIAQIMHVGSPRFAQLNDQFVQVIDMTILDSGQQIKISLPADQDGGIFEGVYYTPNVSNIVHELKGRKQVSEAAIASVEKHKAVIEECNNILSQLEGEAEKDKMPPEAQRFMEIMNQRLGPLEQSQVEIMKMLQELRATNSTSQRADIAPKNETSNEKI